MGLQGSSTATETHSIFWDADYQKDEEEMAKEGEKEKEKLFCDKASGKVTQ